MALPQYIQKMEKRKSETVYFAGGCFWCVEAAFRRLDGVLESVSGYMGGHTENPDYRSVCSGMTGHAEAVRVGYDPERISLETLLDLFWKIHDPTTLNRQGADVGNQYRSAIFWTDPVQRDTVMKSVADVESRLGRRVVTEILQAPEFWPAEEYHQDYFRKNPFQGYCQAVIAPKLKKAGFTG